MTDPTSRQIREAEQKIRILYEITRFVSSLLHLQHVLDAIVDLFMEEFRLNIRARPGKSGSRIQRLIKTSPSYIIFTNLRSFFMKC